MPRQEDLVGLYTKNVDFSEDTEVLVYAFTLNAQIFSYFDIRENKSAQRLPIFCPCENFYDNVGKCRKPTAAVSRSFSTVEQ